MKRIFLVTLTLIVMLTVSACKTQNVETQASVEYVKNYIEEKGGENIRFDDFAYLKHSDQGSGVIVEIYELEDDNKLLMAGFSYDEAPEKIAIITDTNETITLYIKENGIYQNYLLKDLIELPENINRITIQKDTDEPFYYSLLELNESDFDVLINWLNNLYLIKAEDLIAAGYRNYEITINDDIKIIYSSSADVCIIIDDERYSIVGDQRFPIKDSLFKKDLAAGNK